MPLTTPQQRTELLPVSLRFVWIGLALLLATWPAAALSQEPFIPQPSMSGPPPAQDSLPFDAFSGRSGQALGGVVRGGFLNGPGVGREESLVPLEFMPYFFLDQGMFFGDFRGFRSVDDRYGANVGLGYRHYITKWDRIIGGNAFFDYDKTSGAQFRQAGFGLETLGSMWDMRLNTYFPVSDTTALLGVSDPVNLRFSQNYILFDQIQTFGTQLKGLDHEIGVPLPGRFLERHNVKGVAGWYHFQQTGVDDVWGWKGRVEGDVTANVHMGLEVTHDKTFDTNVVFSVALSFGGFQQAAGMPKTQFDRMTAPLQRNYNIVVAQNPITLSALRVQDVDGSDLIVEHVAGQDPYDRSNVPLIRRFAPQYDPTAALGTYENPFLTIQQAQAVNTSQAVQGTSSDDITFVWTNSQFDGTVDPTSSTPASIVTESGVRLLGEADDAPHLITIGNSTVLMPRAVDNTNPDPNNPLDPALPDLRPLFTNYDDPLNPLIDGVLLTSGTTVNGVIKPTEFSGFRLGLEDVLGSGPTGNGIHALQGTGGGVTNVVVNYNDVNNVGQDGILLEGVGTINFLGTRVFNPGVDGLHVVGGTPMITFSRDPNVTNPNRADIQNSVTGGNALNPLGYAVLVENTNPGSLVHLRGLSGLPFTQIDFNGGEGILVQNSLGSVNFGRVAIQNARSVGLQILNSGGSYRFLDDPTATGGTIFTGTGATREINLVQSGDVNISSALGDSILIQDLAASGRVGFDGDVTVTDRRAAGVNLLNNAGDVRFNRNGSLSIFANQDPTDVVDLLNQPALWYRGSSGSVDIDGNLTIARGDGVGIQIGSQDAAIPVFADNTGDFTVSGITRISGMGVNTTRGGALQHVSLFVDQDNSRVTFGDVTIGGNIIADDGQTVTDRGGTGIFVRQQKNAVSFEDVTVGDGSTDTAVILSGTQVIIPGTAIPPVLTETEGSVSFDTLTINDATALTTDAVAGIRVSDMQANVVIGDLDITSTVGKALFAERVGDAYRVLSPNALASLRINGGVIEAEDSRAVDITESEILVRLNSVSVDDSALEGILLENNRIAQNSGGRLYAFDILPTEAVITPGTGGTIDQTGPERAGVRLINTGRVSLVGLQIEDAGGAGIDARSEASTITVNGQTVFRGTDVHPNYDDDDTLPFPVYTRELIVADTEVNGSLYEGVRAIDVPTLTILRGLYEENGDGAVDVTDAIDGLRYINDTAIESPEIRYVATRALTSSSQDQDPRFEFNLIDVEVNESGESDAVQVTTASRSNLTPTVVNLTGSPDEAIGDNQPAIRLYLNVTGSDPIAADPLGQITLADTGLGQIIFDSALLVRWDGIIDQDSVIADYVFDIDRNNSYGININQLDEDSPTQLTIANNLIRVGNATVDGQSGAGAWGINVDLAGPTTDGTNGGLNILDNVIFFDESATKLLTFNDFSNIDEPTRETIGIRLNFESNAVVTVGGDNDNPQTLTTLVPDPDNDFDDNSISYIPQGATNAVTADGPFGNIILSHANSTVGMDITYGSTGSLLLENNVIANEPGDIELNQIGIRLDNNGPELNLSSGLNNIILLDTGTFAFPVPDSAGSGVPFFIFTGGNQNGSLLINDVPVP